MLRQQSYSKVLLVDGTIETNLLEGNYTTTVSQALTKSLKIKLVKKGNDRNRNYSDRKMT